MCVNYCKKLDCVCLRIFIQFYYHLYGCYCQLNVHVVARTGLDFILIVNSEFGNFKRFKKQYIAGSAGLGKQPFFGSVCVSTENNVIGELSSQQEADTLQLEIINLMQCKEKESSVLHKYSKSLAVNNSVSVSTA